MICNDYLPKPTCQSDDTVLEAVSGGTDKGLIIITTGVVLAMILAFN